MSAEQVLTVAMQAVHAMRKFDLALEAAVDEWEQGRKDTPENSSKIKQYGDEARRLQDEAIDMYDQLNLPLGKPRNG